jgi:hypothetical protein
MAVAFTVICSLPLFGGDLGCGARVSDGSDDGLCYSNISDNLGKWVDDTREKDGVEQFELSTIPTEEYEDIVPCGEWADHLSNREETEGERESVIDFFLPRSNLPLPLMRSFAEERDVVLPLPFGTSAIWTEMDRFVAVGDVRLGLGNTPPVSVNRVEVPTSKFHASSVVSRIDMWLLPCFNLYAIVGHTHSTGNVAVTINDFPLPVSPPVSFNVPVDLYGPTAGWGCTTGIGANDWIATLDVNQTWTAFSRLDSKMTALVVTPRVGRIVDQPWYKGEIHVGAMWQDTAQTVELTLDHAILGNDLHIEVDQFEPDPWNFLVGGLWAIDERLQIMYEGGMGGRSYVVSGIVIRY